MLTEVEKRAAWLAVSRFGADRARVQSVVLAHAQDERQDFLDLLVGQALLTKEQARELRLALDATQVDIEEQRDEGRGARGEGRGARGEGRGTRGEEQPPSHSPLSARPAPLAPPLSPVRELRSLGDYRILRQLGEGGMGSVYLGYREGDDHQVAIKVLADRLACNQAYVDRFYREARSGMAMNHPNIVRGYSVAQDKPLGDTGKHYLVLEYVDGTNAHALIARFGQLSVGDAVHIVLDIARALEHAHSRNIIHRDIKPDNILITKAGVAKLADLGLSKRTDETSHLTGARQGFGTPYYMPYEQALNAKMADCRSDIYALGATLYHLLTGEVPFGGDNHLEVVEKKDVGDFPPASALNILVPAELDQILEKMLAREPGDRYQTASELIVDLERSNLAAAVPSFADQELALQDPVMRARLVAPAQATRPDLTVQSKAPAKNSPDLWYLRYHGADGKWCKARATTQQIKQRLREGRLVLEDEACHQLQEGFQPLNAYAEFSLNGTAAKKKRTIQAKAKKEADDKPAPEPATPKRKPWWKLL